MDTFGWGQFGLAGTIALSLGAVIIYIFKLFLNSQTATIDRIVAERNAALTQFADQQKVVLITLSDVARVMSEVQQMLREREIQQVMLRQFEQERHDR